MKVLIIGGTRFMGPHVVRQLAQAGHDVMVFHRGESPTDLPAGVTELLGDRDRLEEYRTDLAAVGPEVVIDMFALCHAHATGLGKVFSGMARRCVVISSGDVYRNYDGLRRRDTNPPASDRLDEDSPLRSLDYPYRDQAPSKDHWLYDYDKIHVEREALGFADLPVTILRLPMVYGPGDRQHRLFPYLKRMRDSRPAILLGEIEAGCQFGRSYMENAAAAIVLAAVDDRAAGRIYNVAEHTAYHERHWIEMIAAATGWGGKIIAVPDERLPEHLRSDLDWRYHLDMDSRRIREELGFAERVPSDEALLATVEWESEHPPDEIDQSKFDYAAEDRLLAELP